MKHLKNRPFLILTFLWICVIFGFSLQSGDESTLMSAFVLDFLAFVLPFLKEPEHFKLVIYLIRKLAHFTEYFILGFLSSKAAQEKKQNKILLIGYLIPIFDEGIQLFSPGRSSSPIDMLIDMAGYVSGLIVFGGFINLLKLFKKNWTGK